MYLALDRRFSTVRCLACGLAMVLPRLGVAEIKARYPYLFAGPHIGRHVPRAGSRPSPSCTQIDSSDRHDYPLAVVYSNRRHYERATARGRHESKQAAKVT
jgi:hypothetical protein